MTSRRGESELSLDPSVPATVPGDDAVKAAGAVLAAACQAEETRFSALNTRAVSLVSASSLITALIGIYSKDFLGAGLVEVRGPIAFFLAVTLVALIAAVLVSIIGVLLPADRLTFGNNQITSNDPLLQAEVEVHRVIWSDYVQVLEVLQARNKGKARALNAAYVLFTAAVVFGAVSVLIVIGYSISLGT